MTETTVRVRFAPSPTGSLHLGSALTAVANRTFADENHGVVVLRIDDTDETRHAEGSEDGILRDLEWLGVTWDEGPIRQSERGKLYSSAAERLVESGAAAVEPDGAVRFGFGHRPTLLRADGRATYHLASVVDDVDLAHHPRHPRQGPSGEPRASPDAGGGARRDPARVPPSRASAGS